MLADGASGSEPWKAGVVEGADYSLWGRGNCIFSSRKHLVAAERATRQIVEESQTWAFDMEPQFYRWLVMAHDLTHREGRRAH